MNILQNMELFQGLMLCGDSIYTWCYDVGGTLLHSNCPDETVLGTAFIHFGGKKQLSEHARSEERARPLAIGTAIGMMWYAAAECENGEPVRFWTIGPVFYKELSFHAVEQAFSYYDQMELSLSWKLQLFECVKRVPVATNILMQRYTLMLHYCLSGERLTVSDICQGVAPELSSAMEERGDRHKVYMTERAMLDMVRNGDLDYREALGNSMSISSGVPVEGTEALRQGKTSVIVFITLVSRAAMEGGLSAETAYSLGDKYIQAVESSRAVDELSAIAMTMYDDFVNRVHKLRADPGVSALIRRCCDYIEMNIEKKFLAGDLARVVGYSEYYLTQRFRKEMGVSFNDYVRAAKIERAKTLLTTTEDTTAEIARKLSFGTRSYFSQVFTELAGMPPQEYRETNR